VATESTLGLNFQRRGAPRMLRWPSCLAAAALSSATQRLSPTPARAMGLHPFRGERRRWGEDEPDPSPFVLSHLRSLRGARNLWGGGARAHRRSPAIWIRNGDERGFRRRAARARMLGGCERSAPAAPGGRVAARQGPTVRPLGHLRGVVLDRRSARRFGSSTHRGRV